MRRGDRVVPCERPEFSTPGAPASFEGRKNRTGGFLHEGKFSGCCMSCADYDAAEAVAVFH